MIILTSLLLTTVLADSIYNLYKHSIQTGARCLDGTPAAFYYSPGSDQNSNNFLIYFEGGGFCGGTTLTAVLQSCYQRSKTNLGSSSTYKQTRNFQTSGILSNNPINNPQFYNWNKFFIPYCDGSLHQGTRFNPVQYKDSQLYFRGTNNTLQHFNQINKTFGIYAGDKIVITGVSAGGIATYIWSNYIYERAIRKQVISIPDSGIFILQFINPFTGKPTLIQNAIQAFKLVNQQIKMPLQLCVKDYPDQIPCFSAGNIVKYLQNPFFVIESQYDLYCIGAILSLKCVPNQRASTMSKCNDTEKSAIQSYRRSTLQALNNFTTSQNNNIGVWSPACIQHGFIQTDSFNSDNYQIPTTVGIKIPAAIQKFIQNPYDKTNIYIDDVSWPSNNGCSGLKFRHIRY